MAKEQSRIERSGDACATSQRSFQVDEQHGTYLIYIPALYCLGGAKFCIIALSSQQKSSLLSLDRPVQFAVRGPVEKRNEREVSESYSHA